MKNTSGIGGWLAFFIGWLFLIGLGDVFVALNVADHVSQIVDGALAISAITAAVMLVRKQKQGILVAKIFLSLSVVAQLFIMLNDTAVSRSAHIYIVVINLWWLGYLTYSTRVKNTYVGAKS